MTQSAFDVSADPATGWTRVGGDAGSRQVAATRRVWLTVAISVAPPGPVVGANHSAAPRVDRTPGKVTAATDPVTVLIDE